MRHPFESEQSSAPFVRVREGVIIGVAAVVVTLLLLGLLFVLPPAFIGEATTRTTSTVTTTTSTSGQSTATTTTSETQTGLPADGYVRIRVLDNSGIGPRATAVWAAPGYNAQSILSMIRQLDPAVLERYTSGPLNASMQVPVCEGCQPMTVLQFLQASESETGAVIVPRLSLQGLTSAEVLLQAQGLIDLPLSPPLKYLSLDNYVSWASDQSPGNVTSLFQQLYAQGWVGVGVNECGGYYTTYGYATFAAACVNTSSWVPDSALISRLSSEPGVKLVLLYVDFPGQMESFENLSADRMASVLTTLAGGQASGGYTFVYNVLQNSGAAAWDSTRVETSTGESIFSVIQGLLQGYG